MAPPHIAPPPPQDDVPDLARAIEVVATALT